MSVPIVSVSFDVEAWTKHLNADDPLALVIRGHLYAEAGLVQLIESAVVDKTAFDAVRLPFQAKLAFAVALGKLPRSDVGAIKVLNRLRDRFAHNLKTELCDQDELDLYNALSPRVRQLLKDIAPKREEMPFMGKLRLDIGAIIVALEFAK